MPWFENTLASYKQFETFNKILRTYFWIDEGCEEEEKINSRLEALIKYIIIYIYAYFNRTMVVWNAKKNAYNSSDQLW